jgi:hypothetical protein
LAEHTVRFDSSRALDKLGNRIEISRAMIAMTTSNSINVNAFNLFTTVLLLATAAFLDPFVSGRPSPIQENGRKNTWRASIRVATIAADSALPLAIGLRSIRSRRFDPSDLFSPADAT